MPRPRTNDPLGVSDNPNVLTDPARILAVSREFQNKLAYIREHFLIARQLFSHQEFNASLALVRHSVGEEAEPLDRSKLHIEIATILSYFAGKEAAARGGSSSTDPTQANYDAAARRIADTLKTRRGRPKAQGRLHHHVEGFMALLQETSGKPIVGQGVENSVYSPHFTGANAIIPAFFKAIDPSITDGQLVSIIKDARHKYAGKPMRFSDFFPAYRWSAVPIGNDRSA